MKKWWLLLSIAITGLISSAALAADATGPDSPQSLAALWPMLGVSVASIVAYGLRKLSTEYTFFHSGLGAAVLTIIGSTISTVTPVLQAGHFTWAALAWAAVGAVTSFTATLNPSVPAGEPPPMSPKSKPLSSADVAGPINIAIALLFGLSLSGCATPGGQAFKTCELNALPSTAESILAEVVATVTDLSSSVANLEQLAQKLGPTQVGCVLQALQAWFSTSPAAAGQAKALAVAPDRRQHARDVIGNYFAAHPKTACAAPARL